MKNEKIHIESLPLSHLCHVGDKVEFHITGDPQIPLEVVISIDRETVLKKCTVMPPAHVSASLPHPGFLLCTASAGEVSASCGVGVDPDQIRPLEQEPEDFDRFWAESFKELEVIPEDFRMTQCDTVRDMDIYHLDCATVNGLRAYGMLAIPHPRENCKKFPLKVMFGGGEAHISEEGFCNLFRKPSPEGDTPCACLHFHLPPYAPVKTNDESKSRHNEFLKSIGLRRYIFYGLDSPKKFYAYPAILGYIRLLNRVAAMPEIRQEAIIYSGASHGGGFGLYLCCFSKHIKAAFCGVPNFGDIAGVLAGRHQPDSNSPEFRDPEVVAIRKYFDASYCAKRITCPVYLSVGFTDTACAPTAVYAIYNNLAGPKMIFNKIHHGHGDAPPEYAPMCNLWLKEKLKELLAADSNETLI